MMKRSKTKQIGSLCIKAMRCELFSVTNYENLDFKLNTFDKNTSTSIRIDQEAIPR